MNRFVLDTSVAVAWCFEDEDSAHADRVLDLLAKSEALVPPVWPIEVGNALLAGERRKRITASEVSRSLKLLSGLPISLAGTLASADMDELVSLARARSLSAYDAAFLLLAMREGLPLATLDAGLARAARDAGVALL